MSKVLVVDDEVEDCRALEGELGNIHEVRSAYCMESAQRECIVFTPALILLSLSNGHETAGLSFLDFYEGAARIVVMTDRDVVPEVRIKLVSKGVYWEIPKPLDLGEVRELIRRLMEELTGSTPLDNMLAVLDEPHHRETISVSHTLLKEVVERRRKKRESA